MPYSNNEKNKECYKKYYLKNRKKFAARQKKRREDVRNLIRETKLKIGGCKCGETHLSCLDFHHRDEKDKLFDVSSGTRIGYSVKKIKEEIAKCDILCKNCHAKLHWKDD